VWLSAFFLAVFAGMSLVASSYDGGSRTLPLLTGATGAVLSGMELRRSMRRARTSPASRPVLAGSLLPMLGWLGAGVAAVAGLGILLGAVVFVAAFLSMREGESTSTALVAGLVLAAVLHLALERGLGLRLYGGLFFG
jgi:hypothetical protein